MPKRNIDTRADALALVRKWTQAAEFIDENPNIIDVSLRECRRWKLQGMGERWGINGLHERLRWVFQLNEKGATKPRLQNDFRPFLARWLVHEDPDLDGLFDMKECWKWRADEWLHWRLTGEVPVDLEDALAAVILSGGGDVGIVGRAHVA